MFLNKESAMERLAALGMDDMPVIEYRPTRCSVSPDWFKKYTALRREFLSSLTDSFEEIAFMNLPQDEFINLIMGKELPENTSLRLKVPLIWGGDLSIENMFLCYTFPHSQNLDRFIIEQINSAVVYLPNPEKKIYVTTHLSGGGDGGNATSDRLTQSAGFMMSGRGND